MIGDLGDRDSQPLLGRYRIVRPLAQGGMGIVYLARVEGAAGFSRPVVVKTVMPHLRRDSRTVAMFVREARILSHLQHPSIVTVLDFGMLDDAYLMVLEYVHGYHLGHWIQYLARCGRRMEVDHALYLGTRVLEALHYAHELRRPDGTTLGIVHRDVSPANVLIDVQGQVKLHDFGIARMIEEGSELRTQTGSIKATLSYAAPEIFRGLPATVQSDLYSCAVVLYQSITGRNPFRGPNDQQTIYRILTRPAPPLGRFRADVPPELEVAIARALSKDPAERFPSAGAFAQALRAARQRPEEDVAVGFARAVAADFLGDLPRELGLESLSVRDQAWREAQPGTAEAYLPLGSSRPGARVLHSEQPPEPTINYRMVSVSRPAGDDSVKPVPGERPSYRWGLALGLALGLPAPLGALFWLLSERAPAAPSASFVVIEKQRTGERATPSASVLSPSVRVESKTAPVDSVVASTSVRPPAAAAAGMVAATGRGSTAPSAAQFSRTFQQQQQAKIERCFSQFAAEIEGEPRIMVRFSVTSGGTVESAELSPAALAASALGRCILQHARQTRFGPQAEPLSFVIPITVRRAP